MFIRSFYFFLEIRKSSSNIKIGRNTFRNSWLASLWESISWFLPGQGAAPLMTSTPDEKFPPIDPDSLQVTFSQLWWFGTYNRVAGGFPAGRHSPAGLMEVLLICVSVGERVSECVCVGGGVDECVNVSLFIWCTSICCMCNWIFVYDYSHT